MIASGLALGVGGILSILAVLAPLALLVALQVWLCRQRARWLGLILPVLSLVCSLLLVLSLAVFTRAAGTLTVYDSQGNVVQEEQVESGQQPVADALAGAAVVFLVANIPTVVFGGIWLNSKTRRDLQEELRKMDLKDLE